MDLATKAEVVLATKPVIDLAMKHGGKEMATMHGGKETGTTHGGME